MDIVVISSTKYTPTPWCSYLCWYYTVISSLCSSLVALERRRRLCAFMLVWAHELSGEKRMANLGLSEVEKITRWKPNTECDKTAVWMCVCLCGGGSFQSEISLFLFCLCCTLAFLRCWSTQQYICWFVQGLHNSLKFNWQGNMTGILKSQGAQYLLKEKCVC